MTAAQLLEHIMALHDVPGIDVHAIELAKRMAAVLPIVNSDWRVYVQGSGRITFVGRLGKLEIFGPLEMVQQPA